MEINTTRATILTITITTTTTAVNHEEESIMFVAKKVVALISIQTMSNKKHKNYRDKTENSAKIKINTTHFWLIMKEI